MKKRLITIVLIVLGLAVLDFPVRRAYVVPILMYHKVDKNESYLTKLAISPETFERQMQFLKRNRYNVVSLDKLIGLIENKKKIPHHTIAISFDDGYESNYLKVFPILKKYNLPATIFVIVDFIGKPDYLTKKQISQMLKSGLVTMGSHTLGHLVLTEIEETLLDKEIFKSKKVLEAKINAPVELFSYPLGAFNKNIRDKTIKAGYIGATATNPGKGYPSHDTHALKRIRISESASNMFVFWAEISGYYTFIKEHRDD